MSEIPTNAICVVIAEASINQLFGLMMDNMLIAFHQEHPQSDPAGLTLKALTARLRPSISDAPHGPYGTRALLFDSARGKIQLHELDLKWDQLDLEMALQLKERDITLFGKTLHLFAGSPLLDFTVPLARLIRRSEVDIHLTPEVRHQPPQEKDGQPIPQTEGWVIGFRQAMVEFDVFDLEGIFEEAVVDALKQALANALLGHSITVDALTVMHLADPVFEVQNRALPPDQRKHKARQLALADLRGLIDSSEHLAHVLDLPDDLLKWVYDRFHINLDLLSWLSQVLARFLNEKLVIPLPASIPIQPPESLSTDYPDLRLLPLQIPLRSPLLSISADELLLQVEVGTLKDLRE